MTATTATALTYTARPALNGGFILSNEAGFETKVPTLKFARSYVQFGGNNLIVLKKDGTPKN